MGVYSSKPQLLSRGGPSVKTETLSPAPPDMAAPLFEVVASSAAASMAGRGALRDLSSGTSDEYQTGSLVVGTNGQDGARNTNVGAGMSYTSDSHDPATASGRHKGHYVAAGGSMGQQDPGQLDITAEKRDIVSSSAAMMTQASTSRGRPAVSGMDVMVGGVGSSRNGGGQEDRKFVGAYSPEARRQRIQRFLEKREHRVGFTV